MSENYPEPPSKKLKTGQTAVPTASSSSSSESDSSGPTSVFNKDFFTILDGWLEANQRRVIAAYKSGKGWEGWLHVELYLAITDEIQNADIRREPRGYGKAKLRTDFVLNVTTESPLVIEIKSERTDGRFWQELGGDIVKVTKLEDARSLVIGVVASKGALLTAQKEVVPIKSIGEVGYCFNFGS